MSRVDLDKFQQRAERARGQTVPTGHGEHRHAKVELSPESALALVAELRAAREVVDAARKASHAVDLVGTSEYSARVLFDLDQAVRAHDQQTGATP